MNYDQAKERLKPYMSIIGQRVKEKDSLMDWLVEDILILPEVAGRIHFTHLAALKKRRIAPGEACIIVFIISLTVYRQLKLEDHFLAEFMLPPAP